MKKAREVVTEEEAREEEEKEEEVEEVTGEEETMALMPKDLRLSKQVEIRLFRNNLIKMLDQVIF